MMNAREILYGTDCNWKRQNLGAIINFFHVATVRGSLPRRITLKMPIYFLEKVV
jgi:hypothetical protein